MHSPARSGATSARPVWAPVRLHPGCYHPPRCAGVSLFSAPPADPAQAKRGDAGFLKVRPDWSAPPLSAGPQCRATCLKTCRRANGTADPACIRSSGATTTVGTRLRRADNNKRAARSFGRPPARPCGGQRCIRAAFVCSRGAHAGRIWSRTGRAGSLKGRGPPGQRSGEATGPRPVAASATLACCAASRDGATYGIAVADRLK